MLLFINFVISLVKTFLQFRIQVTKEHKKIDCLEQCNNFSPQAWVHLV